MAPEPVALQPYLARLRALPFVQDISVRRAEVKRRAAPDFELEVQTESGKQHLFAELKKSHVSRAVAEQLLALRSSMRDRDQGRLLLLAPAVGRELGELLEREHVGFMDLAGNCYLDLGGRYVARIQGRTRSAPSAASKGLRAPAYRALFALLADPSLARAPVRTLADAAGVSRQAALDIRKRLVDLGILAQTGRTFRWVPGRHKDALDTFVTGYFTTLRPGLVLGRFRTPDSDPAALEKRLESVLRPQKDFRWGGGAAGHRLTGYYRGAHTVVHTNELAPELARKLRAISDRSGPLEFVAHPGPLSHQGATADTAHPLLVYAELLFERNERAREAAQEIADRFLSQDRYT